MSKPIKPSKLGNQIQKVIKNSFNEETIWMTAEILNVNKYPKKKWCFLTLVGKDADGRITEEFKGTFWSNTYDNIEMFEKITGQTFATGLEITCRVQVAFHKHYGITLDILEIDQTLSRMLNILKTSD